MRQFALTIFVVSAVGMQLDSSTTNASLIDPSNKFLSQPIGEQLVQHDDNEHEEKDDKGDETTTPAKEEDEEPVDDEISDAPIVEEGKKEEGEKKDGESGALTMATTSIALAISLFLVF